MSRTYKTADRLKKKILCTAGRYFKKYGYDKTTYQMIANDLKISKAAIAYHFKTKPWIIYKICEDYIRKVYAFVRENIDEDFNCYKCHCIAQLIIYRAILRQERNITLFFHKDHVSIWENEQISVIENYYREIAADFKKKFNDEEIHAVAVMNLGAKLSLIREYAKAQEIMNIDTQCKNMLYLVGVLSKLDEATIQRNIDCAFLFADSHTPPKTDLID